MEDDTTRNRFGGELWGVLTRRRQHPPGDSQGTRDPHCPRIWEWFLKSGALRCDGRRPRTAERKSSALGDREQQAGLGRNTDSESQPSKDLGWARLA